MKRSTSILPLLFCLAAQAEAAPPEGHITLPYQQFVELTGKPEAVQDVEPPVAAVLTRADYLIDIRDGQAVVSVEWLADNHTDKWAWVAVVDIG